MSESVIGIIGIVIGTVLGFILSEGSSIIRERRLQRREKQASERHILNVRTMLRIEIEQNIGRLREFRDRVVMIESTGQDEDKQLLFARGVVELPFPGLSHKTWENHLREAPIALNEREIKEVSALHNSFDYITEIRSELIGLYEQQRRVYADHQVLQGSGMSLMDWMGYMGTQVFDLRGPELWVRWETAVLRDVFDKGNPINE